jgi:hypothetical protein
MDTRKQCLPTEEAYGAILIFLPQINTFVSSNKILQQRLRVSGISDAFYMPTPTYPPVTTLARDDQKPTRIVWVDKSADTRPARELESAQEKNDKEGRKEERKKERKGFYKI